MPEIDVSPEDFAIASDTPTTSGTSHREQGCGRCRFLPNFHTGAALLCNTCALLTGTASASGSGETSTRLGQLFVLLVGSAAGGVHAELAERARWSSLTCSCPAQQTSASTSGGNDAGSSSGQMDEADEKEQGQQDRAA